MTRWSMSRCCWSSRSGRCLRYTRAGLILRAVGENHDAAHALGYRVVGDPDGGDRLRRRLAGLGGAYISLVRVPQWTEGMTAGAGWIALAIVVFASWRPWRVLIGAYLFGGVTVLQLNLQAAGVAIPVEYLSMSPYLITILVLVIMSARRRARRRRPGGAGQDLSRLVLRPINPGRADAPANRETAE